MEPIIDSDLRARLGRAVNSFSYAYSAAGSDGALAQVWLLEEPTAASEAPRLTTKVRIQGARHTHRDASGMKGCERAAMMTNLEGGADDDDDDDAERARSCFHDDVNPGAR